MHDIVNRLSPLSVYPTFPLAFVRGGNLRKGVHRLREGQMVCGQLEIARELSADSVSDWDYQSYWQDMSHLFGLTDSPLAWPHEQLVSLSTQRGLSVSGYALTKSGVLVQEMAIVNREAGGTTQARSIRLSYGSGQIVKFQPIACVEIERGAIVANLQEQISITHDRLCNIANAQIMDVALARARALSPADIQTAWDTSRAGQASLLCVKPHPDAALAF